MDVKTDILIIGSGIASLQAARLLGQYFQVQIVTKSSVKMSSSYRAQGGIAAVTSPEDHTNLHIADTLAAGEYHHEKKFVETLIKDGSTIMRKFLLEGLPIDRQETGEPALGLEGAHSHHRILHAGGDRTGQILIDYLLKHLPSNISIHCNELAFELMLNSNGECIGVMTKGEEGLKRYFAHHVILATGGAGALYPSTSNYATNTGDGIALAYRAGAAISDMEFMQFHPSLLWCDGEAKGLVSEAVRGAGGIFVNAQREPIMTGVHPLLDLAPRHVTAHTLYTKRASGQETFIDITNIQHFEEKFPTITKLCIDNGIDLQNGLIPVAPGSHFLMGGVIADDMGRTTIANLYAVGEVACTGVHGANRLASNSLLEGITFGQKMAQYIIQTGCNQTNFTLAAAKYQQSMPPLLPKEQLQQAMMHTLGIVRNPIDMQLFVEQLPSLQDLLQVNVMNFNAQHLELYMMHIVASLMGHAALTRTETRGAHIRNDTPNSETDWAKRWIIFQQGQMKVRNSMYEYHQSRGNAQAIF
ncbi:L-aspartate oxidase [Lysinibacillus sphaericus]|uniref:L-aspartate oxidase n=1 Tax=Lysinibacillus sphaericus TaxID=1421 RepID=A0A2S0JXA8_LYSSH|nr:L-aspartate oxidase [Lysinibacillus sphaericus]AVK95780.1 L-aspartate oxidase [Lysinibacillus sphaericus]MED4546467.1 L-aspartate oxidase [Lysinibacillus sphaericus]TKI16871.1 L-aspartate oxidase [Lysinibacillus sphaericus]SUV18480.1 L-aspartate oxidase [Lysinibacillus sphaericus]GEC84621.1 L-aspartate oxidase [Lysinibacillus sphaericus]